VGEFHYIHNGPDGKPPAGDPNRYAEVVIDAAREVGLRIALLRACYDTRTRAGQERFAESPEAAHRAVVDLATRMRDRDGVTVMPAPHSLHGASAEMIAAAVAAAEELNTRFHIHLAEQPGDAAFSHERYGTTPLRALEKLGALSARTVAVHGLYLDDEERRALAGAGGALVVNPTTNAHLGDGTTDLAAVLNAGIDLALGTDADQAPSIFEEMRALEYAARSRDCRMGVAAGTDDGGARALLRAASAGGGNALGLPVGWLAKGEYADFVTLDLHHPSLLPASLMLASETRGESISPSPLDLAILHSLDRGAVRHVHVGGKAIVKNSQVLAMPPQELTVLLQ
jgi:cytosine/adenosine deaminase-related metal-dependent hydrolase